jgi:hypothetical protein
VDLRNVGEEEIGRLGINNLYIHFSGGGGIWLAKWFLEGGNASASGGGRPVPEPGGDRVGPESKGFSTFQPFLPTSPESVPSWPLLELGRDWLFAPGWDHATRSGMSACG